MKNNRWLIAIGLGIFVLICSIASFSVGVYVGENGWALDSSNDMRSMTTLKNQPAADGIQRLQATATSNTPSLRQGLPPGKPQVLGWVQQISEDQIYIITQNGIRQISITESTRIETADGSTITLNELNRGNNIAVYGEITADDGKVLVANVIIKLRQQNKQ